MAKYLISLFEDSESESLELSPTTETPPVPKADLLQEALSLQSDEISRIRKVLASQEELIKTLQLDKESLIVYSQDLESRLLSAETSLTREKNDRILYERKVEAVLVDIYKERASDSHQDDAIQLLARICLEFPEVREKYGRALPRTKQ